MDNYKIFCEILSEISLASLRFRPKSDALVKKGVMLADAFKNLSDDERAVVATLVLPGINMKLLGLSGFMAESAVNTSEKKLIESSIILHLIEDFKNDYRENFKYLVLIAFASNEIGVDFNSVGRTLLPFASNRARYQLESFLNRDSSLNKLSAFGMKGEVVNEKFLFLPE